MYDSDDTTCRKKNDNVLMLQVKKLLQITDFQSRWFLGSHLLEKKSKYPQYIIWNVEENEILHKIFREVSRFQHYISCYIAES